MDSITSENITNEFLAFNQSQWTSNGSNIYLNSSVGIGTSFPRANLDVYGSINALSANFGTVYTGGTVFSSLNVVGIANIYGNLTVSNLIVTGNFVNVVSNTQFSNAVTINNAGTSTALRVHQLESVPTHTNNVAEFWDYQTLALLINGDGNVGIHTTLINPHAFAVVGSSNLDYIKTINVYSSNAVAASNLYGNVVGSNTVSASKLYGPIIGSNTVSASGLYGPVVGSNTITGTTISGSTLYGQLAGSNTIAGSSLTLGAALDIAYGGTGQTNKTDAFNSLSPMSAAGDLIYGGPSGSGTRLAPGTSTQILHGGTTPSWSAVSLMADVSGTLPVANGGTGLTSTSANFIFAGPTTGAAAAPTWRGLVSADIPNNAASTSGSAGSLSTTFTSSYILFGQGTGVPNYSSLLTWDGVTFKANATGTSAGIYGKRFYAAAVGDNTDTPTTTDNAGGPWYGLGYSVDTGLTSYVQLAGWAGLSFKTGTGLNVMDDSGRIGIGVTNPTRPLIVKRAGSALTDCAIMVANNGTGSGVRFQTYDLTVDANAWMGLGTDMGGNSYEHSIVFPYGSSNQGRQTFGTFNGTTYSTKMTILGTGYVGIGTTPLAPLHIYKSGTGGIVQGEIRVCSDDNQKSRVGMYEESQGSTWGCWVQYNGNGDMMEFGSKRNTVDTSPQMTISSTGTVDVPGVITNAGRPMSMVGKNNGGVTTGFMIFNAVQYNIGSMYNSTTGKWTASVAGYYQFTFCGISRYGTNGPNMRWYKNNADYGWGTTHSNFTNITAPYHMQQSCSVMVYLAVNDYFQFYSLTDGFYGDSTLHNTACCFFLG